MFIISDNSLIVQFNDSVEVSLWIHFNMFQILFSINTNKMKKLCVIII